MLLPLPLLKLVSTPVTMCVSEIHAHASCWLDLQKRIWQPYSLAWSETPSSQRVGLAPAARQDWSEPEQLEILPIKLQGKSQVQSSQRQRCYYIGWASHYSYVLHTFIHATYIHTYYRISSFICTNLIHFPLIEESWNPQRINRE